MDLIHYLNTNKTKVHLNLSGLENVTKRIANYKYIFLLAIHRSMLNWWVYLFLWQIELSLFQKIIFP